METAVTCAVWLSISCLRSVARAASAPSMPLAGAIFAHLGMLHYVYNVTWHVAYAAPVMLGLGVILAQLHESANMPLTSSMGRLFDAVASLFDGLDARLQPSQKDALIRAALG